MLGDLINRGLVLVLGYAYPAFECFKTVEKNKVEIEDLSFWCQYWIIVALLTVLERIGDVFVSWFPMYGEMKLALFIYLWYPKTKGSGYIYETFLRPYVAKHETDIERNLQELRTRAWDLAIYFWQNFTNLGQKTFFEMLQYLAFQSANITKAGSEKTGNHYTTGSPPPPPKSPSSSFKRPTQEESDKRRSPSPPPSLNSDRSDSQPHNPETVQVHLHSQTQVIHTKDTSISQSLSGPGSTHASQNGLAHGLHAGRFRFRRFKGIN
ncbi:unnamed protein product [Ilex paraguariensis]|uniref:HVA22-like protein n=1 Tax=Ilex paraguariensis TaxID=185542 RepID=A0ABC8UHX2_9AQUA